MKTVRSAQRMTTELASCGGRQASRITKDLPLLRRRRRGGRKPPIYDASKSVDTAARGQSGRGHGPLLRRHKLAASLCGAELSTRRSYRVDGLLRGRNSRWGAIRPATGDCSNHRRRQSGESRQPARLVNRAGRFATNRTAVSCARPATATAVP